MANLSVEKLASVIGSVPEILLSQMQEAGLNHKELSDDVTDSDKKTLLDFLKNQQKKETKTISLKSLKTKSKTNETGAVAITRKTASKETASSFEEKAKKTSTTINFEEIERKRVAGENQKKVDEDKRKQQSEQKTLITRRKAKSKESPVHSKDEKKFVKSTKTAKSQRPDLSKKEIS